MPIKSETFSIAYHLPFELSYLLLFLPLNFFLFLLCGTQPHRWNRESGVRAGTVLNISSDAQTVVSSLTESVYLGGAVILVAIGSVIFAHSGILVHVKIVNVLQQNALIKPLINKFKV